MSGKTCSKCGGRMEEGFLIDRADGDAKKVTEWVQGAPQRGFLGIIKTRGKRRHTVETWRCDRCSYLESYAPQR